MAGTEPPVAAPTPLSSVDVLAGAVWLGVIGGAVEAVGMLLAQQFGPTRYVSVDVLWVAPAVNLVLFVVVGTLLAALARLHTRLQTPWLTVFPLAALLFANWLEVAGLSSWLALYALGLLALGLASGFTRWLSARHGPIFRSWRRTAPWLVGAVLLMFIAVRGGRAVQGAWAKGFAAPGDMNGPNVLLVVLDALRADHLSSYGYARQTSPNLDRFAAEGVLYEHAFSTSPWSLPAHASLLAGRTPSELGVGWHDPDVLSSGEHPVLPEVLQSLGYRTGAVSANVFWVTHERLGRGFAHFDDYYSSPVDMVFRTNLGRAFERVVLRRLGVEDIPGRRHAPDINRALLRWIDRDRDRPFFALVNYFDVHDPYLPPAGFVARFSPLPHAPGILNWRVGRSDPDLSTAELKAEIDAYDSSIAYLDQEIGALRRELESRALLDSTIVILVSDHGESFGEHGWYLHGHSLYLEQLQVPWIVRWPGSVPAGMRIARPVSIEHVPALILDLLAGPEVFPGPSHTALWADSARAGMTWPRVLAETEEKPWAPEDSPAHDAALTSVIGPRWHLIQDSNGRTEIYAWPQDRKEVLDLSTSPDGMAAIRRLRESIPPR